ncbi:hypothetical protein F2Q69_00019556 [Brassica cretica]|uniref:Uncharacterized protein n=1 Tax=Brassica cretica TaxID=69181 RepID=A0A8S9QEH3_BRACR|nr:hypothetical protein F2Q69_00019556 [Brassica cretica]
MKLRSQYDEDAFLEKHGIKLGALGLMSGFIKSAVSALQHQPVVDVDDIIYRNYVDIIIIALVTSKSAVSALQHQLVVNAVIEVDDIIYRNYVDIINYCSWVLWFQPFRGADIEKTINSLAKKANEDETTNLMKLRSQYDEDVFFEKHGIKLGALGLMSGFIKSAVSALQHQPVVDVDDIIYRNYVDIIIIALVTSKPFIRGAYIEKTINSLAKKANEGTMHNNHTFWIVFLSLILS